MNAIKPDGDGGLLVDARDTWTSYDVDRQTGDINWQVGGKASTFTQLAAPGQSLNNAGNLFAWQHDPESIGNDEYTVFDDESAGKANTGSKPWRTSTPAAPSGSRSTRGTGR